MISLVALMESDKQNMKGVVNEIFIINTVNGFESGPNKISKIDECYLVNFSG